jgi:hypothetical protein
MCSSDEQYWGLKTAKFLHEERQVDKTERDMKRTIGLIVDPVAGTGAMDLFLAEGVSSSPQKE